MSSPVPLSKHPTAVLSLAGSRRIGMKCMERYSPVLRVYSTLKTMARRATNVLRSCPHLDQCRKPLIVLPCRVAVACASIKGLCSWLLPMGSCPFIEIPVINFLSLKIDYVPVMSEMLWNPAVTGSTLSNCGVTSTHAPGFRADRACNQTTQM